MITSRLMMFIFRKIHPFPKPEFYLTELITYDFDLDLNIGELIKLSNIYTDYLEIDRPVEARVVSKSKILTGSDWIFEYVVRLENYDAVNESFTVTDKTLVSSDSDVFLMTLVELADKYLFKTTITILVKGTIIEGHLISEDAYFEGIKQKISNNHIGMPNSTRTGEFLQTFKTSKHRNDDFKERKDWINREYIHLESARIHFGESPLTLRNEPYWRGRLSSIDGYWLESLSEN